MIFFIKIWSLCQRSLFYRYIIVNPKLKIALVALPEMKHVQMSPAHVLEKCTKVQKKATAVNIPCGRKCVAVIFSYRIYKLHVIT